jgi:hypothetical protein
MTRDLTLPRTLVVRRPAWLRVLPEATDTPSNIETRCCSRNQLAFECDIGQPLAVIFRLNAKYVTVGAV